MTNKETLAIAKKIAGDRATITPHKGLGKERAIRISGCFPEDAREIGKQIETALGLSDSVRIAPGFAAVWYR